ncbi:MAG TPA: adenylate/guanylate cyclase domain-containing protein, partial [Chloroflexota bacterium]|nr:adenylate/guanylate cyclase domain-containing protein [Chloroflexota bacterium]
MASLPGGTVTFLFTDIEGSTRRWEKHREAMQAAVGRHDELLRQAVESNRGHVFKTGGDAIYAVFASAPDAVLAALGGQRRLTGEDWGEVGP